MSAGFTSVQRLTQIGVDGAQPLDLNAGYSVGGGTLNSNGRSVPLSDVQWLDGEPARVLRGRVRHHEIRWHRTQTDSQCF